MSKKVIYGVFDRKIKEYVLIRDSVNIEDFKRWFVMTFMDGYKSVFSSFPADYDIYDLCGYDSETGVVTCDYPPALVCNVDEMVKATLNEPDEPSPNEIAITPSMVNGFKAP